MKKISFCAAIFLLLFAACGAAKIMAERMDGEREPVRFTVFGKPDKCPACGNSTVASIMYGLPVFTDELKRAVAEGKIVLGGCVISGRDPRWKCTSCGALFYEGSARSR